MVFFWNPLQFEASLLWEYRSGLTEKVRLWEGLLAGLGISTLWAGQIWI